MNPLEFRALLDLIMCCDPWPVADDGENQRFIQLLADREARRREFPDWISAYHEFKQ